jgi:hypothetical protein
VFGPCVTPNASSSSGSIGRSAAHHTAPTRTHIDATGREGREHEIAVSTSATDDCAMTHASSGCDV